jgi:hypothetical protein
VTLGRTICSQYYPVYSSIDLSENWGFGRAQSTECESCEPTSLTWSVWDGLARFECESVPRVTGCVLQLLTELDGRRTWPAIDDEATASATSSPPRSSFSPPPPPPSWNPLHQLASTAHLPPDSRSITGRPYPLPPRLHAHLANNSMTQAAVLSAMPSMHPALTISSTQPHAIFSWSRNSKDAGKPLLPFPPKSAFIGAHPTIQAAR